MPFLPKLPPPRHAQSLAKIYLNLIFSTKNRERVLANDIRTEPHACLGGIRRDLDSPALEVFLRQYNVEFDERYLWDCASPASAAFQAG